MARVGERQGKTEVLRCLGGPYGSEDIRVSEGCSHTLLFNARGMRGKYIRPEGTNILHWVAI